MRHRTPVRTLAALAVLASGATTAANPILLRERGPVFAETELLLLVVVSVLLEWAILAAALRIHLRSPWKLVGVVALAHVLSIPATAAALLRHGIGGSELAAELVAVGIEFLVYAVALFGSRDWSPVRPGGSILRLLGATCAANLATWMIGLAYIGVRVRVPG